MNANPERTTLTSPLTQEPSTSRALERVRSELAWLVASATKFAHPDKQVQVQLHMSPHQVLQVLLSGPEAEAAIRQLMQAYADSIGKSVTFCAHPVNAPEHRHPVPRYLAGRSHRGITRDWNYTCTDTDCWCWGSEFHNPRDRS